MTCRHLNRPLPGVVLGLLTFAGSIFAANSPAWETLPPLPEPNGGLIAGVADGSVVVVGGTNWEGGKKNWLQNVYVLDPAALNWDALPAISQPVAYGLGGTWDGRFVVVAGSTGVAPFTGVVRVAQGRVAFDPTHGVSEPAVLSAGGVIGDEMVIVGGTDNAANGAGFSRRAHAFNLRTGQVRALAEFPGPATGSAASAVVGDELLVFAGATWDSRAANVANHAEAWAYAVKGGAWRRLRSFPEVVRGVAAVALDSRRVYLAGGYLSDTAGFTNAAWIYDVATGEYRAAAPLPIRAAVTLVKNGDFVYCLGGEDRDRHRTRAAFRIRAAALEP